MSDYPEHEKLSQVQQAWDTVQEFLEWLENTGYEVVVFDDLDPEGPYTRAGETREDLIADFLDLNLSRLHNERDQMLERLKELNQ